MLHAWDLSGAEVSPFPLTLPGVYYATPQPTVAAGRPALVTLAQDGGLGMIGMDGTILRQATVPDLDGKNARILMADIDGDGKDEVLLYGSGAFIEGYDDSFRPLPGFPVKGVSRPQLIDIDRDGRTDFVTAGIDGRIYAYTMMGTPPVSARRAAPLLRLFLPAVLLAGLLACQSMPPDQVASSAGEPEMAVLDTFDLRILDLRLSPDPAGVSSLRADIDRAGAQPGLSRRLQARVSSLRGEVALLSRDPGAAKRYAEEAAKLSDLDQGLWIVRAALEQDPARRLSVLDAGIAKADEKSRLLCERGRERLKAGQVCRCGAGPGRRPARAGPALPRALWGRPGPGLLPCPGVP